jgi:excisionase family DNA binding protein
LTIDLRLVYCKHVCVYFGVSAESWNVDVGAKRRRPYEGIYEVKREWGRMMEDRWLSVDEIAGHLGVKRDTVYKWISERQMPGHKIGRLWKFNKKEVDEWVRFGGTSDHEPGSKGDR